MTDLFTIGGAFNIVATVCIIQMGIILAMVEKDRACKSETPRIIWSRRAGFAAGGSTLAYAGITHDWATACLLMAIATVVIFTVNIISIRARNHPPLHGHRFFARTSNIWRRYP
jgi:hypothetical protein